MKLYIDATDANGPEVVVLEGEREIVRLRGMAGVRQAQQVLSLVDKALLKTGLSRDDITDIEVNPGPGSFTGTRVGVALANSLSLALRVPINGQPAGSFVAPVYDSTPKITLKKDN